MQKALFISIMSGLFSVVVCLHGCTTPIEPVGRIPFPVSEYNSLNKEGTGIVSGQAFLRTRGGDVKTAAGQEVFLNPVTSYSDQWYEVVYIGHVLMPTSDSRLKDYMYMKIADGDGRFSFKDVPPGEYYLTTTVTWEAPVGYRGSLILQGGLVCKKITVENDKTLDVILTR